MRRRVLMAASQPSGEGTPEFPLYLNSDYCEESWGYKYCYIRDNEVAKTYYDYIEPLCLQYHAGNESYYIPEEVRISLGIEIYFDGKLATDFNLDSSTGNIFFNLSPEEFGQWWGGNIMVESQIL